MRDPAINRLQRAIEDSKQAKGMSVGLPTIAVARDDAERILLLISSMEREAPIHQDEHACQWVRADTDDAVYASACGREWATLEPGMTLEEMDHHYCPWCGGRIETSTPGSEQD